MLIGTKLRQLRRARGLTLDELAEKAGASKSYLWELEKGGSKRPSAVKLQSLALALGVTTEFLLDDRAAEPGEDDEDLAFFSAYRTLDPNLRRMIRIMVHAVA